VSGSVEHPVSGSVVALAPRRVALHALAAYRLLLSPWLGPACRYEPTCSEYASQAIERHGVARGSWLALTRLSRCHPLGGSGYDPVP